MIKPSIEDLTKGKINRYELVLATAKCARDLTDEYTERRAEAERKLANKETDKTIAAQLKLEASDEKAVKAAINRISSGEYVISKVDED
ncbi:MAG: DNA-directed RNA polymerase subunit omega [Clostridia bacterium]|nr:DNA-directed RNA polymerase subunit omega [Clostridia bacterium]MBR6741955.1 DNA-directed RNA polymerase subunit omega [Clostridia bacterium]